MCCRAKVFNNPKENNQKLESGFLTAYSKRQAKM